jgi:hypothetical protein
MLKAKDILFAMKRAASMTASDPIVVVTADVIAVRNLPFGWLRPIAKSCRSQTIRS